MIRILIILLLFILSIVSVEDEVRQLILQLEQDNIDLTKVNNFNGLYTSIRSKTIMG